MRLRALLALSAVATAMSASAAFAGSVSDINGVFVPVGSVVIAENEYETNVQTSGALNGFGIVTGISNGGGTITYGFGDANPPPFLYSVFGGFSAPVVTGPPGAQIASFTGGYLDYYEFTANQQTAILNATSVAAAQAIIETGTLFLSLAPVAETSGGATLILNIPNGLGNADQSSAQAYLDPGAAPAALGGGVGIANSYFNTCTFTDLSANSAACPPIEASLAFSASAQNNPAGTTQFAVTGTSNLTAFAVPEPITLSLFGAGLVGAGFARRRKAKKA